MDINPQELIPPPTEVAVARPRWRRPIVIAVAFLLLNVFLLVGWVGFTPRIQVRRNGIASLEGPAPSYWIPRSWIPVRFRPWFARPMRVTRVGFHTDCGDPLEGMRRIGIQDSVRTVSYAGRSHGPEMLPKLARTFPALQELRISGTNPLSPGDCRAIQQMTQLQTLHLVNPVEPGGFVELSRHPNASKMLWRISLRKASAQSLRELADAPVTKLQLEVNPAEFQRFSAAIDSSPAPLPHLANFIVNIYGTSNTVYPAIPEINAGMKSLTRLPQLTHLGLSNCGIDDSGVQHLGSMIGLQNLNLAHSQVTDAGCRSLSKLTNLHALNLGDSRITIEGVRELIRLNKMRALSIKTCPNLPKRADFQLPPEFSKGNVRW